MLWLFSRLLTVAAAYWLFVRLESAGYPVQFVAPAVILFWLLAAPAVGRLVEGRK